MSKTPAQVVRVDYSWDKFPVGYGGIHGCIAMGSGNWNIVPFNAQLGQSNGRLRGPHELLIKQVDKGQGWVNDGTGTCGAGGIGSHCDTSLTENDGFECPAGLDPKWQALGAKPFAWGGYPLCLKYKVAGEPCGSHAYDAVESSNFPCPWNSSPNYSLLKPVGEGDTIHDAYYGAVTWGEFQLVVKKTVNALQDIDLIICYSLRYRSGMIRS